MVFKSYVQIGRVVTINYGDDSKYGKSGVIVDILDHNRVLVEGLDLPRQTIGLKQLKLTTLKVDIPRSARTSTLRKACEAYGLTEKLAATPFVKKLTMQAARKNLSDFDRFKLMVARKRRSHATKVEFNKRGGKPLRNYV